MWKAASKPSSYVMTCHHYEKLLHNKLIETNKNMTTIICPLNSKIIL